MFLFWGFENTYSVTHSGVILLRMTFYNSIEFQHAKGPYEAYVSTLPHFAFRLGAAVL